VGSKTLEGSLAFLLCSFIISLAFVVPVVGAMGAGAATLGEALPEVKLLKESRMGAPNDNLVVPLIAGLVMSLI